MCVSWEAVYGWLYSRNVVFFFLQLEAYIHVPSLERVVWKFEDYVQIVSMKLAWLFVLVTQISVTYSVHVHTYKHMLSLALVYKKVIRVKGHIYL